MIKFKGTYEFSLPQCWGEVQYSQYKWLQEKDLSDEKVAAILTGLPIESVTKSLIEQLSIWLEWMKDPLNIEGLDPKNKIDIKKESFGKLLLLENAAKTKKYIDEAITIYFPELDYISMPLSEVLATANDLYAQLIEWQKKEASQLNFNPSSEMERAGIDKFNQFGRMNTIDTLAGGDILKYEDVLKIDCNTVFAKLKRSKVENDYQKNYQKIMSEKK